MREHPVPQDITGYRFHIIGEMTIKQFAEVAIGVVIAFLLFNTNLPALVKFPLMILSSGLGALMAFVPIEERPVEQWVAAFIRVLYKPTQYYWRRDAKIPSAFKFTPMTQREAVEEAPSMQPERKAEIKEYLFSLSEKVDNDPFTQWETARQETILAEFGNTPPTTNNPQPTTHNLQPTTNNPQPTTHNPRSVDQIPQSSNIVAGEIITPKKQEVPIAQNQTTLGLSAARPNYQAQTTGGQMAKQTKTKRQRVYVPDQEMVSADHQGVQLEGSSSKTSTTSNSIGNSFLGQEKKEQVDFTGVGDATQSLDLPFPNTPTEPNKIVGMLLTPNDELINDAIVEIKNESEQVLRAVKSNSLGQFFISTPLENGNYIIGAEKDGFQFPQQKLILTGEVIAPIEIRSQ